METDRRNAAAAISKKGPGRGPRQSPAALVLSLLLVPFPARAQEEPSRCDYRIEARAEPGEKGIGLIGSLELAWTNRSGDAVSDLWFHLYLNAFANNRSSHMVEAGGRLRDRLLESEDWGWSRVTAARLVEAQGEGADLLPSLRYRRPDDEREEDRSVFSLDLPRAIQSGETVRVAIEWESKLPRVRRRTGTKDDFLFVAQWFPKLGVYEGGRGWNCHQFHANTEFFSDYGTYEVTLDLPAAFANRVGGTGVLDLSRPEGDGRVRVRFHAPSEADAQRVDRTGKQALVHDFAWTADPDFVVASYIFRPAEWAERFPSEVEFVERALGEAKDLGVRDVDVTVLLQPEHAGQADRHFKATCAALFFYGLWFGEYPYQHVTVVDPAFGAGAAGGMEYPTLFTCGSRLYSSEDMHTPEGVTVHECGHQFWYGLVGNNEFEAAWLDEGFNSFTDSEVLWRVYGAQRGTTSYSGIPFDGVPLLALAGTSDTAEILTARRLPLPWIGTLTPVHASGFLDLWRDQPALAFVPQRTDPRWHDRSRYLGDPDSDPIDTYGWKYADRQSYSTNSYARTAVALRTLRGVVGPEAFLRGMRHYSETWRYRHPYPDDFFAAFQQGAQCDVGWYFQEIFRGTGTVDWSVEVTQERRADPRGFFQGEGGQFIERAKDSDAQDDEAERPWHARILLRRTGTLTLPIPLRLRYADDSSEDLVWTREEQQRSTWLELQREGERKLVSVELDPAHEYFIDVDRSNDAWFDATDELGPWRYGERALARWQRYFHWIGGLGG